MKRNGSYDCNERWLKEWRGPVGVDQHLGCLDYLFEVVKINLVEAEFTREEVQVMEQERWYWVD